MSEPNAMHVHAVATKYASSQLEISRSLCAHLTLAAGVDARLHKQIGFQLMYANTMVEIRIFFFKFISTMANTSNTSSK